MTADRDLTADDVRSVQYHTGDHVARTMTVSLRWAREHHPDMTDADRIAGIIGTAIGIPPGAVAILDKGVNA